MAVSIKHSTIVCLSALALLSAAACAHDTRYVVADNGGGGGSGGSGGGDGGGGGGDGGGGDGNGGGGDGGGSGGDGGGGSPPPPPPPPPPSGLASLTGATTGTLGNVIYSSGNTVKDVGGLLQRPGTDPAAGLVTNIGDRVAGLGQTLGEDGLSGVPIVGNVVDGAVANLDRTTAPAAKITIADTAILGSGASGSQQAIGATIGSQSPVQGTLASANLLTQSGAAVSANVAGGQIASVAVLPNGVGLPGGAPQVDSLVNLAAGGNTILPGGENALLNVNALPEGLSGVREVANLQGLLSPGSASPLAPVTGLVGAVTGTVTGAVGDAKDGTGEAAGGIVGPAKGLVGGLLAPLTPPPPSAGR